MACLRLGGGGLSAASPEPDTNSNILRKEILSYKDFFINCRAKIFFSSFFYPTRKLIALMRNIFIFLLHTLTFSILLSCQKPKADPTTQPELKVDKTSITLKEHVNSKDSFTIQSNISWSIAVSPSTPSWLSVSSINIGINKAKVFLTVKEANNTGQPRVVNVSISPLGTPSVQAIALTITQNSSIQIQDTTNRTRDTSTIRQDTTIIREPTISFHGKWSVINDSLANNGYYDPNYGYPIPGNYIGNANDYMDFRTDGKLYYQIYWVTGSTTYEMLSDNKLSIKNFILGHESPTILNLTANSMTLYGTKASPNGSGGQVISILNLKR